MLSRARYNIAADTDAVMSRPTQGTAPSRKYDSALITPNRL